MNSDKKKKKTAVDAAVYYLYSGNKSSCEIRNYLKRKEYADEEIEKAMSLLTDMGYADDLKYARWFLEAQLQKGRGLSRIRQELQHKRGVSREITDRVFFEYEDGMIEGAESEFERAMTQAGKILDGRTADEKLIGKIARRLSYLGFDTGIVMEVCRKCRECMKDEDL